MSLTVELAALAAELSAGALVTDPDRMDRYRFDRARDPGAGMPLAVVRAGRTQDVQAAVRFAARHRLPVVPRGAGSGLSGGASAVEGCLVVSLERMTALRIDPATRTATVEPGVLNADLKAAAARHGLWYPPDPSSYEICSIGGNVATNAGGLCCVKYGVTGDYVLGLTRDSAQAARADTAYGEIMDLAIGLGGTITGEHGVGRLKRPWLPDYLGPEALALNRRVKEALDPLGILNPGAGL